MEGEAQGDWTAIVADPIDPAALVADVRHPGAGAVVLFLGTIRDHSPGRDGVTHLEYEAYASYVESKIRDVVTQARAKWELQRVIAVHRVGRLEIGEVSVGVAVSAGHRPEAFEAGRFIIDELKATAPIWKKEHWPGGAEWVREGSETAPTGAAAVGAGAPNRISDEPSGEEPREL